MKDNRKQIGLLGASFDTGNLGVSALAWSSIKIILNRWPHAEIILLGVGRQMGQSKMQMEGNEIIITTAPIRFCKNIVTENHIIGLFFSILLTHFRFNRSNSNKAKTKDVVLSADLFCDITGGDSFSDIYGMKRFIMGWLSKKLCQMTGKPFVMLPQTYGPFRKRITKWMAANILKTSTKIFSRDQQGVEEIKKLIGGNKDVEVIPDVAFVMDSIGTASEQTRRLEHLKADGCSLIGLNISGLLFNGGYSGRNEFGLKCDYKSLLHRIILYFIEQKNTYVVLIPHVVPLDYEIENDLLASRKLWELLSPDEQKKVIVLDGEYDQNQVKYCVGLCTFFMGARMHSAIAALSQSIPAVGMAYSKKFAGVFNILGVSDCVVNMLQIDENNILDKIKRLYAEKELVKIQLEKIIPEIKLKVMSLFDHVEI